MEIDIEGKTYTLYVKEKFIINDEIKEQEIPLDEWTAMVSKRVISSLFSIEEKLSELYGRKYVLKVECNEIRKPILNLSGSIDRLAQNITIHQK